MKTAGFVIEGPDEMPIKDIIIGISDLSLEFATQKNL